MSLDSVLGSALMVRLSFTGSMSHSFWNPQICKYQDSVLMSPLSYRKVQLEKGDSFCLLLFYFVSHEADLYGLYHLDSFALSLLVGLIHLELKEIRE